ncbi:MAG TPA: flagellar biosynthesis protein FliQ [Leptospiraceae bacterium]|nr:flagellar biosynthesis protein FliQ [Leptospiraceae bacterium]HMZ60487.1 flagellar biosynthesis protein FliQ [Leptospiraceae bacterium]HNF16820.1 flagellar biosynthesis protein FliQ [Leptospiraceae bacterium]HNF24085.1 flagellar biosynthesis protein FliQ [Leptospiraceae bacterium]HNH08528.1 flagellar biosynthesis protein FliQ [Leptospiraceae bacterium]
MTELDAITLLRDAIFVTLKISSPILITALIVGFVIGVLQTTTSIQEPTIAFVPKLIAIFVVIVVFSGWIIKVLTDYTRDIFMMIEKI